MRDSFVARARLHATDNRVPPRRHASETLCQKESSREEKGQGAKNPKRDLRPMRTGNPSVAKQVPPLCGGRAVKTFGYWRHAKKIYLRLSAAPPQHAWTQDLT